MRGRGYEESRKRRPTEDQIMSRELNARPPHKRPRIPPKRPPWSSSPNCFVRAVGDPLVECKEPVFDWDMADDSWEYWDFCPPGADLSMRDKDPASTFEADKRRLDEALERMQRRVDLEHELHRAYPFLSENALMHQGQLHPTGYSTNSLSSAEEQSQESTSVPMLGLHPDDQPQSSHSTQPPMSGSDRDELQHHYSENYLPTLGPWLEDMQQNHGLRTMPMAGPSCSTFSLNSEPDTEMYLGSQPRFGHMSHPQSANTHNSSWLDDDLQQPIVSSWNCNQQYLELSSVPNYEFQQNMPEMLLQQQSWSRSRNSVIACDQQQQSLHMEGLMMMPTSGGANSGQHNFWYSNEGLVDSRWQQVPSTSGLAPGIRACSAHSALPPDPRHGVRQPSGRCDRFLQCSQPGSLFFHSSF